jgi:trehalose 6-phosphate phosphatase
MTSEPEEALLEKFWQLLARTPRRILMLDYDGTLAPFRAQRNEAVPYPQIIPLLTAIQNESSCRLVIISGRAIDDLLPLLAMDQPPEVWGAHGLERQQPDGPRELFPIDKDAIAALEQAALWAEQNDLMDHCECKHGCLALHWRSLPEERVEPIRKIAENTWPQIAAEGNLYIHLFDGGMEMRHPGRTKGDAVKVIFSEEESDVAAAYLGDDVTDEDAFKAVRDRGVGILVRGEKRPTEAGIWLRPPDDLVYFLRRWQMICERAINWEE